MMKLLAYRILFPFAALALYACGGGGDSANSTANQAACTGPLPSCSTTLVGGGCQQICAPGSITGCIYNCSTPRMVTDCTARNAAIARQTAACNASANTDASVPKCDYSSASTAPERCFGGLGTRCEGNVPPYTFSKDISVNGTSCYVSGHASAGSVFHDSCCKATSNSGFSCLKPQTGTSAACATDWDLAVADVACARVWGHVWGPYPAGNAGDNTNVQLRAESGSRIHPAYQSLCSKGRCVRRADGAAEVHNCLLPALETYCVCE